MDKIVEYIAAFFVRPSEEHSDLEMLEFLPCDAIYLGERVNFRGKVFQRVEPTENHPYHFVCEVDDIYAGETLYWDAEEEEMVNTICHFYYKEDGFGGPLNELCTVSRKGSRWSEREHSIVHTDKDDSERINANEKKCPDISVQEYEKLWTEYLNEVKKMITEDFNCIGGQVTHGYDSIERYSRGYAHTLPDMAEHRIMEFCSRIDSVLEKAKFLDNYFTYCTLSGRPADMALVNWWFDELCKS